MPTWEQIAEGFNAWLEEYIERPETFTEIEKEIAAAIDAASNGEVPTYGTRCAATLERFIKQLEDN